MNVVLLIDGYLRAHELLVTSKLIPLSLSSIIFKFYYNDENQFHDMPNWNDINIINCKQYFMDDRTQKIKKKIIYVKIAPLPFATDSLRSFYCLNLGDTIYHKKQLYSFDTDHIDQDLLQKLYVATSYIYGFYDPKDEYLNDIQAHYDAQQIANEYNKHDPPIKIQMEKITAIQIINQKQEKTFYHLRPFVHDFKVQDNNRNLDVSTLMMHDNNTPSAFSHFSYSISNKQMIIRIKKSIGYGYRYSHPAIYTNDEGESGLDQYGEHAITNFEKIHKCNHICRYLNLSAIKTKQLKKIEYTDRYWCNTPNSLIVDDSDETSNLLGSVETSRFDVCNGHCWCVLL